jgi:hypothetical protein
MVSVDALYGFHANFMGGSWHQRSRKTQILTHFVRGGLYKPTVCVSRERRPVIGNVALEA